MLNSADKCIDLRGKDKTDSIFGIWKMINRIIRLCQCTVKGPLIFRRAGSDFSTSLSHFECSRCKLNFRLNYSVEAERSSLNCWKQKHLLSLIAAETDSMKVDFLRTAKLSLIEPSFKQ